MIAWRIDKAKRSKKDSFSGEGARLVGGRWNMPGTPAVYLSETLSLASLEAFVHAGPEGSELQRLAYEVELPDELVETLPSDRLPRDWRAFPPSPDTQSLGSQWLEAGKALALRVPSAVIPAEYNVLLNPRHAGMRRARIGAGELFSFDPRMWKKRA